MVLQEDDLLFLGLKGNPDDSGKDSDGYIPNDDELEELDDETAMMDVN